VAATESTVLITGETGTGKELVARLIHASGPRRDKPFVAVNCSAIPEALLESELFGHEKGAFTGAIGRRLGRFELANGGSLFLDEIGDIAPVVQVKLLRVLQEREIQRVGGEETLRVHVRVIAATNQDLAALVAKGAFRSDLFYRLNVIPLALPPLRQRLEDIGAMAEQFLVRFALAQKKRLRRIAPETLALLKAYRWPGNVRELENLMERLVTLSPAEQTVLLPEMLPQEFQPSVAARPDGGRARAVEAWTENMDWNTVVDLVRGEGSMDSLLRRIEWGFAKRAIRVYGSKSEAARALKRTYRWIRKLEKQMESYPDA
jgi:transcriptional regulator with GAF, ATPase, and Fis domain